MTNYASKRSQEIEKWQENLKLAKEFRKKVADYDKWKDWKAYYRNDYAPGIIPVNLIFSIGRSIIPRVYFRNPQVSVIPLKPGMEMQARIVEALDNWMVRRIGFKQTMKKVIQDAYLTGTGIIKLGYDSEFGYDPSVYDQGYEEPVFWDVGDYEEPYPEYNSKVFRGLPWALRIPGRDFLVPWGCESLDTAEWVAHRYLRRLDDIKADPKFENTKGLKGTHTHLEVDEDKIRRELYKRDSQAEYVELWEIYDKRERRIKVIATGYDKYLRNVEDDLYGGQVPYESLIFNDDGDYFWGISDCKIIEPQQLELNEIRTQYQEHRKLSLIKMLVDKGAISPEDFHKLESGEIGRIIPVNGDPRTVAHILSPHIPPDLIMASREVRQDIRETVGFSRNQMGEFDDSTRRTATEASIVQQAASIRVDERRDVTANLFAQCVARMNKFIFQNWTDRHVLQVVGPEGGRHWVSFTGPQIAGDYELRVDPESSLPVTKESRKADALQLLGTLGPIFAQIGNQKGLQQLITHVLESYEGINPGNFFPDPEGVGGNPENAIPINEYIQMMGGQGGANIPIPL